MFNAILKLGLLAVLALIGVVGLLFYRHQSFESAKIGELESLASQQRDVISQQKDVIDRLEVETRLADLVVAGQDRQADGKLHTSLLMVEYDRAGKPLPPRSVDVLGEQVHLDGLVVKFDAKLLQKPDALRGHALLLFEKIYGDAQAPADGTRLDVPGQIPAVYRDESDPKVGTFERSLWQQFWQLADDAALREKYGVKVAHGTGVFAPMRPGVRYTVTLAANGNVTLYDEPLPALISGLLDRNATADQR